MYHTKLHILYFHLQYGPMAEGISPVEANDRLQVFQVSKFHFIS